MRKDLRESGIDIIGDVPWGTHFCQFYQTKEDLADILVPYFKAGLENNEFCLWITSYPMEEEEAKEALERTVPDIDTYLEKGQIEIIPYTSLHVTGSIYDSERVINYWIEKLNHALESGYNGLRLSRNMSWLGKQDWNYFVNYMREMDDTIGKYRMIALGSYFVDRYSTTEIIEIVSNHQFSLSKKGGKWERIDNFGRKKAEEAAIQATKDWEHTFDAVPDLIYIVDDKYRVVRANKAMATRLGVTPEECVGLTCYRVIHEKDEPPSFCPHQQLLKDGLEHTAEVCEDCLGGYFIVSVSPLYDSEGKITGSIHVARDINERKREEEALRQSEERERARSDELAVVLDAVPAAVWITHDPQALQITGNRLSYEWLRIPEGANASKSAPEGERPETFRMFKDGVELQPVDMPVQMSAAGIEIRNYECDLVYPDAGVRHILGNARTLRDKQGNLRGSVSAFIDITERKNAEEALKKAHDNLENAVKQRTSELEKAYMALKEGKKSLAEAQEMAHLGNWERNFAFNKLLWSDEMYRIFGLKPQEFELNYGSFLNYVHPNDRDCVDNALKESLNGKPMNVDFRIILANGEERIVHSKGEVVFDNNNNPVRIRGTTQDITESRKAEEKLRESEEKYRNIVETANEGICLIDPETIVTYANNKMADMLGYTLEEGIGRPIGDFISEEDKVIAKRNLEKRRQGINESSEFKLIRKDGSPLWMLISSKSLFDKDGKFMGWISMFTDITERKEAEKALANIEIARKKEIHHRIKNNLQIISSLLDLQAEKFNNREDIKGLEVLKAFRESQDRVMSIALIHEELHEGRGTNTLNFSPYLERLVKNLFQTYRLGNTNTSLNIDLEENIFFDMDIAVPLGIIINELVSNSLKYAFPGREKGLIQIKLCREKSAECANNGLGSKKEGYNGTNFTLIVLDNGIGIPEDFNLEDSGSLGLQLVAILVDQLGGELVLKRDTGTEFTIKFKVIEKSEQASVPDL